MRRPGGLTVENRIVYISGRKGAGKTSYAHALAREAYYSRRRVIVVAPVGGFSLPGVPVIRAADPGAYGRLRGRSCLVLPSDDQAARLAFQFAWHVQETASAPLLLVVDEVALYLPHHQPDPSLMKAIRYGRHRRLDLVTTSQRPASVHKDLIGQADDKVLFAQSEPNDLAYLRKYTGVSEDVLRGLPRFRFLLYSPERPVRQGVVRYQAKNVPKIILDNGGPTV